MTLPSEEKQAWGWIGEVPDVVLDAPPYITRKWKRLAADARVVAGMRNGNTKVRAAKEIERRRNEIIQWAMAVRRERNAAAQVQP